MICMQAPENMDCPSVPAVPTSLCGVPVDPAGQIAQERLAAVTEGRRKVPLRSISHFDFSTPGDIYIAVVIIARKGEYTVGVSDMLISGSTEMEVTFEDPEGGTPEKLVGKCVLILNPRPSSKRVPCCSLKVSSLKSCLVLGSLSGIQKCSSEECRKPVLYSRDGDRCMVHAARAAGVRVSIGGAHLSNEVETKKKYTKPKADRPTVSAEEQKRLDDDRKRADIQAKKQTALMLLNRRSSTGGHLANFAGDQIEIGEVDMTKVADPKDRMQRIQEFKRKREKIEVEDSLSKMGA